MNLLPVAVAALAVVYILTTLTAGVADNLIAPRHEVLRQTATVCGPYDIIEDSTVVQNLRQHTEEAVAHFFPGATIVAFETVTSPCTPTELGNNFQKLARKFGTVLQIVETDNEGSFLTVMILDPTHATFFALILNETGTVVVVANLVPNTKETQG
jgi:hypothetical protein